MKFTSRFLAIGLLSAMLAACGGGSDSSTSATNDPSDKYVGVWDGACAVYSDGTSARYVLTLNKSSATAFAGTQVANAYMNSTCAGAGTSYVEPGNFTFSANIIGNKSMQGVIADKVTGKVNDRNFVDVMYASATSLRFGGGAPYDAEGFSNVWHPTFAFTKR